MMADPVVFMKAFRKNKIGLSDRVVKKIEAKLNSLLNNGDKPFSDKILSNLTESETDISEYTGFKKPDFEKLLNLIFVVWR